MNQQILSTYKKRKSPWKKFKTLIGWLLILILLLGVIGFIYEKNARSNATQQYPAPGELVNVGGHRLHIYVTGDKVLAESPTVIIETGSGSSSYDWKYIQTELSKVTQVVTYDRAGYGWSDLPTTPRDGDQIIQELERLLEKQEIQGPYIMVAHSLGGLYSRLFAAKYPDQVAGMILVDTPHEDFNQRAPKVTAMQEQAAKMYGVMNYVSRVGLLRVANGLILPPEYTFEQKAVAMNIHFPKFMQMAAQEGATLVQLRNQVREAGSLGEKPLVVISHQKPIKFFKEPEENQEAEAIWQETQTELLQLSSNSRQRIATESGHNIMLEQPLLIIDAVKGMLADLKKLGQIQSLPEKLSEESEAEYIEGVPAESTEVTIAEQQEEESETE